MTEVRYDVKKIETQRGKKLTRGIGINDADYGVFQRLPEGGAWHCPIYRAWSNMLTRATATKGKYSYEYEANYHNCYVDVTICDDWIYFSKFRGWMLTQDWEGKSLDKDLIGDGSIYSPETCCFIPSYLNSLLVQGHRGRKANYLAGVNGCSVDGSFWYSSVNFLKKNLTGTFNTELEAHQFWQEHKARAFREVGKLALTKGDISQEIYQHLLNKADKLDYCRLNDIPTVKI